MNRLISIKLGKQSGRKGNIYTPLQQTSGSEVCCVHSSTPSHFAPHSPPGAEDLEFGGCRAGLSSPRGLRFPHPPRAQVELLSCTSVDICREGRWRRYRVERRPAGGWSPFIFSRFTGVPLLNAFLWLRPSTLF